MSRLRFRVALALAVVAALSALLMVCPILTRSMWIARLALRETSLATSGAALLALALGRGRMRLVAATAGLVGLLPFASQWLVLNRLGLPFSFADYARGPQIPEVRIDHDLVLQAPLRADVYHGLGPGPHPLVVAVHGGSWRGGARGQGAHVSRALAAAGYTVADVEYGVAPNHPFPRGVGDVKCLLGRLRERAAELDLDPHRAVLLGRSAGGQVALVAAYSSGDPRIPPSCPVADLPPQGVIALYAPAQLVYGHANPMRPDVLHGTRSLELYLGGPPERRLEAYRLANPGNWLARAAPPTLLLHGASDPMVEALHSSILAGELRRRAQPVELMVVPFGEHGFDMRSGGVGEQIARQAILAFLKRIWPRRDLSTAQRQ